MLSTLIEINDVNAKTRMNRLHASDHRNVQYCSPDRWVEGVRLLLTKERISENERRKELPIVGGDDAVVVSDLMVVWLSAH